MKEVSVFMKRRFWSFVIIFTGLFFGVLLSEDSYASNTLNTMGEIPGYLYDTFSQNNILFFDPCDGAGDTGNMREFIVGTGDYSNVLTARNAEEYVSNVPEGSPWSAKWSDRSTEDMARLLNNYGDLAYQLGKAVGAPWIAILVQMRYEDPRSVCGANNFWGNGCPPNTPAGHAKIQGKNLGEGFVQYAKTLTNGYHDQALGIADPKEYLEKIGHSWVYGPNDPDWSKGYGSIEAMKNSVDALTAYVNSSEGKAIVKTFGGNGGYSTNDINTDNQPEDEDTDDQPEDEDGDEENGTYVSYDESGVQYCSELSRLRTDMWSKASQRDKERFMQVVKEEDYDISGVEGYMNQVISKMGSDGTLNNWLNKQCEAFRPSIASCNKTHNVSEEQRKKEEKWIEEALKGSNNIRLATGNATGGSNVGAGKIVCVWDRSGKCRDDVDYDEQGGKGKCNVYSSSSSFGECWGIESGSAKWVEEISKTSCATNNHWDGYNYDYNSSLCGYGGNMNCVTNYVGEWDDGWLVEGSIPGMKKEDVNSKKLSEEPNKVGSYTTNGGRPNKILLHVTEGKTNGYAAYPDDNKYPAHFTIDIKKKEGYQHFSLYQPSLAIKKHDKDGPIQIEIVGYDEKEGGYTQEYDLQYRNDEEWDYLATVLLSISAETGIPLTSSVTWEKENRLSRDGFKNYEGVLGHMHAPDNDHSDPGDIWKYVSAAIERVGGGGNVSCSGSNGNVSKLQQTISEFAWPKYQGKGYMTFKPAYAKAVKNGGHVGGCGGADCAGFVSQVMLKSGWDPDFVNGDGGSTLGIKTWFEKGKGAKTWENVTSKIKSNADARPGDVILLRGLSTSGTYRHHVLLYAGKILGFESELVSASQCNRAPMADRYKDISSYIKQGFQVYRKR